ncbi:hypothetical protein F5883DRAFT_529212 [Diaporthe sp. PMI_573]|nr:hypothetical protein F5883DRAFT_529212 [Diaporthaceae sp. PMI_573]
MSDAFICEDADRSEIIAVAEEVYLDEMAPVELRRLWDIRKKRLAGKDPSMWENITRDYLGHEEADALGVEKRAQVEASLQMKFHRGVLRHAVWPARNKAALFRAYVRWEEGRYNEIHRLFMEELQKEGHAPAYKWKSIHFEAELVKEGLEEKQREPSRARRRRGQILARQRAATGRGPSHAKASPVHYSTLYHHSQSPQVMPEVTAGLEHHPFQQYGYQQRHQLDDGCGPGREMLPGLSCNNIQTEQPNAQPQPPLTDVRVRVPGCHRVA